MFSIQERFLIESGFSNFVPPVWKLHHPYCHSRQISNGGSTSKHKRIRKTLNKQFLKSILLLSHSYVSYPSVSAMIIEWCGLDLTRNWVVSSRFYIVQILVQSHFELCSQFGSSSRTNWTGIWTGNSNGSWTDKQSSHFSAVKEISVKATFFFM